MQEDLKKQIFMIVDGSAIVHRAYHAMPNLTTPSGIPTGAVHGFFSMLLRLIDELRPAHIAVAFDRPKPTFRQILFKEYQSQRPTTASDLSPQFGIIIEILKEAGIMTYAEDGFEADDIIGTLAHAAEEVGEISYIVTGDRDMMQLVDRRTKVLMPVKGITEMKLYDEERVKEQFGVPPENIVELKALQGDASDNYPGIPGVGPKTAAGLIDTYKTVENMYIHIDEITKDNPKLGERLEQGKESAIMCHQLATILQNVPFIYDFKDCDIKNISYDKWHKAFEKYEFKTLPKRLDEVFGKGKPSGAKTMEGKEKKKKDPMNQMKLL